MESLERVAESAHCLALANSVSSGLPWPAGAALVERLWDPLPGERRRASGREPRQLWRKRGRTLENVGDFSLQESAHFPWRSRCYLQQMLPAFPCTGDDPVRGSGVKNN